MSDPLSSLTSEQVTTCKLLTVLSVGGGRMGDVGTNASRALDVRPYVAIAILIWAAAFFVLGIQLSVTCVLVVSTGPYSSSTVCGFPFQIFGAIFLLGAEGLILAGINLLERLRRQPKDPSEESLADDVPSRLTLFMVFIFMISVMAFFLLLLGVI